MGGRYFDQEMGKHGKGRLYGKAVLEIGAISLKAWPRSEMSYISG